MATILAKKITPIPMATDDEHHEKMAMDASIKEFPKNSEYGTVAPAEKVENTPAPVTTTTKVVNNAAAPILTASSQSNAASDAEVLVANSNDHWINNKWRPAMGWMYMLVCVTDFVVFPVLWSVLQAISQGNVTSQWQPLTLQGAGLFHLAMGTVLGIAAYGRTKEKIETIKS
jgi:hypothetical protein